MTRLRSALLVSVAVMAIGIFLAPSVANAQVYQAGVAPNNAPQQQLNMGEAPVIEDPEVAQKLAASGQEFLKIGNLCSPKVGAPNMMIEVANVKKCMCANKQLFIKPIKLRSEAVSRLLEKKPELRGKQFYVKGEGPQLQFVSVEDQQANQAAEFERQLFCPN